MFRDIWWEEEEEEWWDRDLICDWNVARMKRITMMIFTICWDLTPRFTTRQLVCNVGLIASYCVETVLSSPLPHISHVPSEMKGTVHRRRLYLRVIRKEPSTDKGEGMEDRKVDPLKRERERGRKLSICCYPISDDNMGIIQPTCVMIFIGNVGGLQMVFLFLCSVTQAQLTVRQTP